jgi:hypothetical protein
MRKMGFFMLFLDVTTSSCYPYFSPAHSRKEVTMVTMTSPRGVVTLSLDTVIRFDNKAIIAAKNSDDACKIAEQTLARLKQLKAPRRYFERVINDGLMKRDEMQKKHPFFMFDKSVTTIAAKFGIHASTKTREKIITVAGYFEMYWFLKQTVQQLRNGPMTKAEFIAMAKTFSVTSSSMDEDARGIIRDARSAYDDQFAEQIRNVLQKRYDDWNDLP